MKRMMIMLSLTLLIIGFLLIFCSQAFAQDNEVRLPEASEQSPLVETPKLVDPGAEDISSTESRIETEEFGISSFVYTWIPAAAFEQRGAQGFSYWDNGYIFRTGGANHFWAPVTLPSGVDIWQISLYCYDNSTNNIGLYYIRYRTDSNSTQQLNQKFTDGKPLFTTIGFDPWPHNIFDNHHQHVVIVFLPDTNTNTMFKGVRIKYRRRISFAPATATFSDVPTNHPFFRQIEALAAAGITTGFSDGTFRPTEPVTRQAMAAFLARALGLHHTDP